MTELDVTERYLITWNNEKFFFSVWCILLAHILFYMILVELQMPPKYWGKHNVSVLSKALGAGYTMTESKYHMSRTIIPPTIKHIMNPLHIYCRLRDAGIPRRPAKFMCRLYEIYLFKYFMGKGLIRANCLGKSDRPKTPHFLTKPLLLWVRYLYHGGMLHSSSKIKPLPNGKNECWREMAMPRGAVCGNTTKKI